MSADSGLVEKGRLEQKPGAEGLSQSGLHQDLKVVGLVGTAHFFAHFYIIVLPPLFPLLVGELQVSYLALGALLTVANLTTSCFQVPVGFLVDRFGPRPILVAGLMTMSGAVVLTGLAPSYALLLAAMLLLGAGNSVFHPADYAVMAAKIAPRRLGRAFSLHTFAGHLGWSVAPAIIVALTALLSWRAALVIVGLAGIGAALFIWWRGALLSIPGPPALQAHEMRPSAKEEGERKVSPGPKSGLALLMTGPMLLLFLVHGVVGGGLERFERFHRGRLGERFRPCRSPRQTWR